MNDYSLKSEITKRLGPGLRPYADKAINYFKTANPGADVDFDAFRAIQIIAADLAASIKKAGKEKRALSRPLFEYSADNIMRSETALEQIRPEIEALRLEIFGKTTTPFKDLALALRWLRKETKNEGRLFFKQTGNQRIRIREIDNKIKRLLNERNNLGESYLSTVYDFVIPFPSPSGFRTYPGTNLRKLALMIRALARLWQFRESALAVYFLTGIKPIQKLMDVTFYGPVNIRDLISFYKQRGPSFKRIRKISAANLSVLEFVKGKGGVPKKNKITFWKKALKEWNKTHKDKRYSSFDGLKKVYERTLKRI